MLCYILFMGSGKLTKPVDILKTISGEQLLEKLGKTLPSRNTESVAKKIAKGEGYVPINKEIVKDDSVLQKTLKGEGYVPINKEESVLSKEEQVKRSSIRDQAKEIAHNKNLSVDERRAMLEDLAKQENDRRKTFRESIYSGEGAYKKAAEMNDFSLHRRNNEYRKNGVGSG